MVSAAHGDGRTFAQGEWSWWIGQTGISSMPPNLVQVVTAILVAEDDPGICDLLTDFLEVELAATVRCERTGSLALQAIETAGFDLAIIDVTMPEISGYKLAMRAANRNIPTLLSTGHPDTNAKLREYDFPYLAKPYGLTELLSGAAIAITQAGENIRRIKASFARLEATIEGLKADMAKSERLINESKALLARCSPPEPGDSFGCHRRLVNSIGTSTKIA
jgi:DNA-binding response OmpR family regulator